jgi:hypothetical protein
MRINDHSVSSNTCLHAHGAIQLPLDDFINSYGPAFSKVGPNNSVRMASSSDVHIAMASSYTNQSSVNCTIQAYACSNLSPKRILETLSRASNPPLTVPMSPADNKSLQAQSHSGSPPTSPIPREPNLSILKT